MNYKKARVFILLRILLLFALPLLSTILENQMDHSSWTKQQIGKWFIFWNLGIDLFFTGVRQASSPELSPGNVFRFKSQESHQLTRELGFANMALGSVGILSVINDQWRLIAAIGGGLYFGLAIMLYLAKGAGNHQHRVTQLYHVLVFAGLVFCLLVH